MASVTRKSAGQVTKKHKRMPPLEPGDRLSQKTFHARYKAMPENVRAELIGGIVYMPSPQKPPHGRMQGIVIHWLSAYTVETPGTEVLVGTTHILDTESEPEPDAQLRVLAESGGRTRENKEGFLQGAAELFAEIAWSTESIDLHLKKDDYERAGVGEYLVVALRKDKVYWFVSRRGKFQTLLPGRDGILRSEVFPGLWLDPAALLRCDMPRVLEVLQLGLASPEHAVFVKKLSGRQRR